MTLSKPSGSPITAAKPSAPSVARWTCTAFPIALCGAARPRNAAASSPLRQAPSSPAVSFRSGTFSRPSPSSRTALRAIYSFENQDGLVHVNWMVHIPSELQLEFQKKLRGWQKKVQGHCGPFDIDIQPIEQAYAKKLAKYVVKGTDPAFVEHFYLEGVASDQGEIPGKRAGVSPYIGPTARRAAGFKKPRRQFTTSAQLIQERR
jgi:hypothetical protein